MTSFRVQNLRWSMDSIENRFSLQVIGYRVPFQGFWRTRKAIPAHRLMYFHEPVELRLGHGTVTYPSRGLHFLPANEEISYGRREGGWHHSWVRFSGDWLENLWQQLELPVKEGIDLPDPTLFFDTLLRLRDELSCPLGPSDEILAAEMKVLAYRIRKMLLLDRDLGDGFQSPVKRADAYLRNHYTTSVKLRDLAAVACVHPSYFCTLYKREFGTTPMRRKQELQVEEAVRLLTETHLSLKKIAAQCGFCDSFYLSKVVKARTGKRPTELRSSEKQSVEVTASS